MGLNATQLLLRLFNQIRKDEQFPTDWQMELMFPIYRKGGKTGCNN